MMLKGIKVCERFTHLGIKTVTTTPIHNWSRIKGNEGVLLNTQIFKTEASPSDAVDSFNQDTLILEGF